MSVITVRVDDRLKKEMEKFPYLNWSEIIRSHIQEVIQDKKAQNLARAVLMTEKLKKQAPDSFNSTEIIRKYREER